MTEYIEKEAAVGLLEAMSRSEYCGNIAKRLKTAAKHIASFRAADVAPVVHGRWEYIPQTLNTLSHLRCPFCEWWSLDPTIDDAYNYCPNCGAKMDGGGDDAAD